MTLAAAQFILRGLLHDIHTRALRNAARVLGGDEALRCHLGASEEDFTGWSARRELPQNIFLRLVDIITREESRKSTAYR